MDENSIRTPCPEKLFPEMKMTMANVKRRLTVTDGQLAVLDSPPSCLAEALEYSQRTFEECGDKLCNRVEGFRLWQCRRDGGLSFPVGLVNRVVEALAACGEPVEIIDERRTEPLPFDDIVFRSANVQEAESLFAIMNERLGQLELPSARDVPRRCALIARTFSESRIVYAVPTRRQARRLWWRLEHELGERVGLAVGNVNRTGQRCTVGTFKGLGGFDSSAEMLLLPYADESLGGEAEYAVYRLLPRVTRAYGLIVAHRHRDNRQQLQLEAMVGPVIAPITKPRSPIYVAIADVTSCTIAGADSPLDWKRVAYWKNQSRNVRIAVVCRAAAARDAKALSLLGVDLLEFAALGEDRAPSIAVLVETMEHARMLAPLLPGWTVYHGPRTKRREKKTAHKEIRKPRTTSSTQLQIVAAVYAAQHTVKAHILVRATGGDGLPRAKGFPPARDYGLEPPPVILIDFADGFHKKAKKLARRRITEYRRAGMHLLRSAHIKGDKQTTLTA